MRSTIARRTVGHAKVDIGRPSKAVPISQDLLIELRAVCDAVRESNVSIVESAVLHQAAIAQLGITLQKVVSDANRRQGRAA